MYSCAYFADDTTSLEGAQLAKLDRICDHLRLGPENHLLEIGTGWGGMAIHAARRSGCRVTTTTISREQFELATQRVRDGRPRRPGDGAAAGLPRPRRALRPPGLRRDDRGGRLAVLRRLLPPLRPAADRRRADAAAGDHDRRRHLRDREGGEELRQHPRLPRRLPALRGDDRRLPGAGHRHEAGLDRRHHRPLPADPGRVARALLRRLGAAARRAATTSASAGSGTSTSPPRRRASASAGSATCRRCSRSRARE